MVKLAQHIMLFTLPVCPNCDMVKNKLNEYKINYDVKDIENEDTKFMLLLDQVTLTEAPIMWINGHYMDYETGFQELGISW